MEQRRVSLRFAVAGFGIAFATALHYLTSPSLLLWHHVFQRLYYLPIIYAAVYFGWRGGLIASTVSAMCFVPHIVMAWRHMPDYALDQYAEIIVFFLVGTVTGVLSDRERAQQLQVEAKSEQLAAAKRELEDSFEQIKRADRLAAIGELSASLAHEIRNPLAGIDGAANLLESADTPAEVRSGSLVVIRREVKRLNRLLTDLLDFARPRHPEFRPVEPAWLLAAIVPLAAHSAERKGINLRTEIPSSVPTVECDAEQIKQVLLNLLLNAVQAMPGPGEIVLSVRQSGSTVSISVADHGLGIKKEDMDKIFNPFYTTKAEGTGLGLSVAHQIILQHSGAISAERNPVAGMTFTLSIPLQQGKRA